MKQIVHSLEESIDAFDETQLHRLAREMHIARYNWVLSKLTYPWTGVIIDAACGRGYGTKILSRHRRVIGIDIYPATIFYANTKYPDTNIDYIRSDLESSNLWDSLKASHTIDSIISFETLEHCGNPLIVVSNFYHALRPDGLLYVSVPNGLHEEKNLDGNPSNVFHVHSFTPSALKELLEQGGFKQLQFYGQAPVYGLIRGVIRKLETALINGYKEAGNYSKRQVPKSKQESTMPKMIRTTSENLGNFLGLFTILTKPTSRLVSTSETLVVEARK